MDCVLTACDLPTALKLAGDDEEVFVIGGSQIYQLALPLVDRLYVTQVHATVDGDTYFPAITDDQWQLQQTDSFAADEKNDHDYSFLVYSRIDSVS